MPDNLYKRGTTWWARVHVHGKDVRQSLRTTSRTVAKQRLKQFLEDVGHARFYGEERLTWRNAVEAWMRDAPNALRPNTFKRYLVSLKGAHNYFGHLYLDEIDRRAIAKFAGRHGVTNATRRRDLTAVSGVLRYAVAKGWAEDNPAKSWDRGIIRERRDPIRPPSDEEVERLVAYVEPRSPSFAAAIRFLELTGMRQEEALSLKWTQVDLSAGYAILYRTKTNRPRTVPLTEAAVELLRGLPYGAFTKYVFCHDGFTRFQNFSSRFAGYRKRVRLAFRCHDLRHKFAIDYLRGGGDIYQLSRILGHSSIKTTEIYLAYVDETSAQKSAQS